MKTQNMLRKSSMLFLIVLLGIGFTNCKKDKDVVPESLIVGDWKLSAAYYQEEGEAQTSETLTSCMKSTVYTFREDGKVTSTYKSGCSEDDAMFEEKFNYSVDDETITLYGFITFDLSVSGNTMTWEFINEEGFALRYVFVRK